MGNEKYEQELKRDKRQASSKTQFVNMFFVYLFFNHPGMSFYIHYLFLGLGFCKHIFIY